ncbi:hypothetical protein HPB51_006947 [Rhipicephalus microplus]|uniref:Receptor ligand binding region domain-containing protein n=1 Tax=Rhipicephalus microplus TaxID=6941 RepID=A0A9J6DT66_RHIMP|nr:hypothetical protein HPB51_006947 [Rhipicephalus microplus]
MDGARAMYDVEQVGEQGEDANKEQVTLTKHSYAGEDRGGGLLKLQHLFQLTTDRYHLEVKVVKRVQNASDVHRFLRRLEDRDRESRKYVVLDCSADTTRQIIISHVRDPFMGRRNYHFLLTSLIMDEFQNNPSLEFGAVNITGFRLVQNTTLPYKEVFTERISKIPWPDPKKKRISADAALMYDGAKVLLHAFKQLLRDYPSIFSKNFRRGEVYNNNTRGIDCRREKVMPWEHGEEIAKRIRSVGASVIFSRSSVSVQRVTRNL